MAQSNFDEIEPDTSFQPIISDTTVKVEEVEKVLLCSGKVYYDIFKERKERKLDNKIAIIRIEQLCPFPYQLMSEAVLKYPKLTVSYQEINIINYSENRFHKIILIKIK